MQIVAEPLRRDPFAAFGDMLEAPADAGRTYFDAGLANGRLRPGGGGRLRMVPLSIGTQTAGSVSRPAAYCHIAAFKPSTRAWSAAGVVPFSPMFDTIGVFGYRVADAVAAARVLMPQLLCGNTDRPDTRRGVKIGLIAMRRIEWLQR